VIDLPTESLRWCMGFLLVLARVGAVLVQLPGLGEAVAPPMAKIAVALAMTLLLLPVLEPHIPPLPDAGLGFAAMIAAEAFAGLWFGWLARVLTQTLTVAMQYVALFLGLSSVLQPDAELGPQTSALARMAEMAIPLLVLSTGLYRIALSAMVEFYTLAPPGSVLPPADGAAAAVAAVARSLVLAMRLASPFLVAAVVWNVLAGLLSRLVPRLQIYFAAMPGQILGGLYLLAMLSGGVLSVWHDAVSKALRAVPTGL